MKWEGHAVWGNCSAKWLFPSHRQAASLHINGRPGYLSGTHINLSVYRHRARRRVGEGCCYQSEMCWACLLGPSSLHTVATRPQSCDHSSVDWSLSLGKSLKELQETAHRFFSGLLCLDLALFIRHITEMLQQSSHKCFTMCVCKWEKEREMCNSHFCTTLLCICDLLISSWPP